MEKRFREKEKASNFGHSELYISVGSPEAAGYRNSKLRNEAWTGDTPVSIMGAATALDLYDITKGEDL